MTQKAKFLTGLVLVGALGLFAIEAAAASFEITPAIQAELDKQKAVVAKWVAAPAIVSAVAEQNRKGPIAGMDNAKWKVTRRNDPMVTGFQSNAAGQLAGFLAYDVVLIVPFLQRLPTTPPEHLTGLIIYTAVVTYSGLLAIYYLFLYRPTRVQVRSA